MIGQPLGNFSASLHSRPPAAVQVLPSREQVKPRPAALRNGHSCGLSILIVIRLFLPFRPVIRPAQRAGYIIKERQGQVLALELADGYPSSLSQRRGQPHVDRFVIRLTASACAGPLAEEPHAKVYARWLGHRPDQVPILRRPQCPPKHLLPGCHFSGHNTSCSYIWIGRSLCACICRIRFVTGPAARLVSVCTVFIPRFLSSPALHSSDQ